LEVPEIMLVFSNGTMLKKHIEEGEYDEDVKSKFATLYTEWKMLKGVHYLELYLGEAWQNHDVSLVETGLLHTAVKFLLTNIGINDAVKDRVRELNDKCGFQSIYVMQFLSALCDRLVAAFCRGEKWEEVMPVWMAALPPIDHVEYEDYTNDSNDEDGGNFV
jgi:hypothetical protein